MNGEVNDFAAPILCPKLYPKGPCHTEITSMSKESNMKALRQVSVRDCGGGYGGEKHSVEASAGERERRREAEALFRDFMCDMCLSHEHEQLSEAGRPIAGSIDQRGWVTCMLVCRCNSSGARRAGGVHRSDAVAAVVA